MSVKIKINWDDLNVISEGVRIYKSASEFTSSSLPAVYTTVAYGVDEFEDLNVVENQTYFYMLSCFLGEQEVFTECFEVNASIVSTGMWIVALAHWGSALHPTINPNNSSGQSDPIWVDNFEKTLNFGAFAHLYSVKPSGGSIVTLTTPIVDKILKFDAVGLVFDVNTQVASYARQKVNADLFFETATGEVLAIIEIRTPANYTVSIRYGSSASSLVTSPTTGVNHKFGGQLIVSDLGIEFASRFTNNTINSFNFLVDLSQCKQIRVASLWAGCEAYGVSGPNYLVDGASAYLTMKYLGRI